MPASSCLLICKHFISRVDLQGGSCLLIGDDSSLILEAQDVAQTKLGCHVMIRGAQTGDLLAKVMRALLITYSGPILAV